MVSVAIDLTILLFAYETTYVVFGLVGVICEGREKYEGFWLKGKREKIFVRV